jgi:transcriptional antiterminator NusG
MYYYALQVKTRSEEEYMKRAAFSLNALARESGAGYVPCMYFPKRKMTLRKEGKNVTVIEPVFPGYVFLETEDFTTEMYWALRTTPGFFRLLPENQKPAPLAGRDLATLKHFLAYGPVADRSLVTFDANNRIHVIQGPLKGLEGKIVKVDKRKGRAKVELDMYGESFLVDLSFKDMGNDT